MSDRKLYFAYGSNLQLSGMKSRCPRAIKRGPMVVPNLALVFRGVADVETRQNAWCYGGLWEITERCEQALDRYEGVSNNFYVKKYFYIRHEHEKSERVLYYQMMAGGTMPPGDRYLQTIVEGYKNFGLPLEALDRSLHEAWNDKEITPLLAERRERRGENMAKTLYPAVMPPKVMPIKNRFLPPAKVHGVSGTGQSFDDYIKKRQVQQEVRLIKKDEYDTWEKDRMRVTNQYKKD